MLMKWEPLPLTLENSKSEEAIIRAKYKKIKTRKVHVLKCEFCVEGNSENILITQLFSDFVWSSLF